jgi:hypothetical protein
MIDDIMKWVKTFQFSKHDSNGITGLALNHSGLLWMISQCTFTKHQLPGYQSRLSA